ncbi:MAG: hypothetical protein ABW206_09320 [Agrobacterium vaccinii]
MSPDPDPRPYRGESGGPETSDDFRRGFGLGFGNKEASSGRLCRLIMGSDVEPHMGHGASFSREFIKRFVEGVKSGMGEPVTLDKPAALALHRSNAS